MLFADKRNVETQLKVNLIKIRENELNFYTQNCLSLQTQASVLAGLAWEGLTQVAVPHERSYTLKLVYMLVSTAAMCFEVIAVMNATLLSIMGPGLFLRGADGSMHAAVDGMVIEYRTAYYSYILGIVFLHVWLILFAWLSYIHWAVSLLVSACCALSLWLLSRYARRLLRRFRMEDERMTGRFNGEQIASAASAAADVLEQRHRSTLTAKVAEGKRGDGDVCPVGDGLMGAG